MALPPESRNAIVDALEFERQAMKWYYPPPLAALPSSPVYAQKSSTSI